MPSGKSGLHLNQVLLTVKDLDRSREFYTKRLGFTVRYDFSPEYVAVVTPNKLQIGLHPSRGESSRKRVENQPIGIEFQVDNVDIWYRKLRERGVRFTEKPKDAWGEREARFKDPDGYGLAISGPARKPSK